jgi:hypothetical protein
VYEAKPRVSFDWFVSSSKLQPYLELCRFIQALFKTKVARWKTHFLIGVSKKDSYVTFFKMDGVLLEVHNQKEGCCAWSLVATTSRMLAISLLLLSNLMNVSHTLFVSNPCLMFLNSACTSFTPQQSVPLGSHLSSSHIVMVSQPSIICPIKARVSLISSKYPTWCRFTLEPCRHDLTCAFSYPSCAISQENIIFNRANDQFCMEVLTQWGMSSWTLELEKVFFNFEHLIELDQED